MKIVCISKKSHNQVWNNVTIGKIYDAMDKDKYPGDYVIKADWGVITRHDVSMFIPLRDYNLDKLL